MARDEVYISVDVEANGPIPGPFSMLSFGAAAFSSKGELLGTFSANLDPLEGAHEHPDTMEFWAKNPEAYKATRLLTIPPKIAMQNFIYWVEGVGVIPAFVGYPATYDFMFMYWYLMNFAERSPFSHSGLDIKTLAMVALKCPYRKATKKNMPKRWFSNIHQHTHVAVDDAIEQGELFINIMKELKEKPFDKE